MRQLRRAIHIYGRVVSWLPYPFIKVFYEDRSGSKHRGPYIIVCNHRGTADAFLMAYLPFELIQVVNIWPFHIPVLGKCARWAEYLDIKNLPPETFFKKAAELLEQGVSIVFFPEGTRSVSREMGQFHSAAFRLFMETKVPIAPVCITGTENTPTKGSAILHPSVIRIRKMPDILWEEFKDLNSYNLKNTVRQTIGRELAMMEGTV